jgi:hypothetical protein
VAAIAAFNVAIANKTVTNLSNLQLANVEALAEKEDAFDYESMGCRTIRCDAGWGKLSRKQCEKRMLCYE